MKTKTLIILTLFIQFSVNPICFAQGKFSKPNIILIFCDDLGYGDLSSYGHPTIKTPNLDKMVAEGIKFTNFYSASSKCSASRYSLLTGRLPIRSGFGAVLSPNSERGIHPKEITLAEGLKDAGYSTAIFGKWHLGHLKKYLPLQHGFDEYIGFPYSNDMGRIDRPIPLLMGNDTLELDPDQRKLTELYTDSAIDFIQRNKEKPLFVYLPYSMPHVPLHPGIDFEGKSKRGTYGDTIEEIDWSVGKIINTLKELNLTKNTLVFFTSDNGPWLTKKENGGSAGLLRGGKGSTWEGGMRVPGIAWWPNTIARGHVELEVVSTMDLYVTAMKLAGKEIAADRTIDGKDISPLLQKEGGEMVSHPYFFYPPRGDVQAVRKGSWKLHTNISGKEEKAYYDGQLPLLFNVDIDPSEQYNLAEENGQIVNELLSELIEHKKNVKLESNYYEETDK